METPDVGCWAICLLRDIGRIEMASFVGDENGDAVADGIGKAGASADQLLTSGVVM